MMYLRPFVLITLVSSFAGCGGDDDPCEAAPFAQTGPWAAGVTTLMVDDVPVEVWYPAPAESAAGIPRDVYDMRDSLPDGIRASIPADAPTTFETPAHRELPVATDGPFPVVYYSHGLGGFRLQSTAITAHLATWGFVVVAPEHIGRNLDAVLLAATEMGRITDDAYNEILAAHERMTTENAEGGRFAGVLDLSRVAVGGHSAGGGAMQALVDDPSLGARAWFGHATVVAPQTSTAPGLLVGGTLDELATPMSMGTLFDDRVIAEPGRLVLVEGAGHLAFTDICMIGRERGGVLRIAQDAGVELDELLITLATDGCQAEALPAEEAWPAINHFTVAHLRAHLGAVGPSPAVDGLSETAARCFAPNVARYSAR